MSERTLEVKVGALILVAAGILVAFVLAMSGVSFQPMFVAFVDFDNPGALQSGSPVKIAGVKIGKVDEVQFRGGAVTTAPPKAEDGSARARQPLVRIKLTLEKRYQSAIHDDASFYVTTQGVLGEQFLQIDPGSSDRPPLSEGAVVRGLDPPRLDMLLAEGFELLHTGVAALRSNRQQIAEMFDGLHDTLQGTGRLFSKDKDRLDRILANVEQLSNDTDELVKAAKGRYVDNPAIDRIIARLDRTMAQVAEDTGPLLHDARETLANTSRLSATVGSVEQQAKIGAAIGDLVELARRAKTTAADAQSIVAHIKHGDGSVGALVMDEQVYDDLQELVRDLKHNPWKFFWRE